MPDSSCSDVDLVDSLIDEWETETVEFKEAKSDFDTDRIGRYVSALSNEANLAGKDFGWLVFGVCNKNRTVVGTAYRTERDRLDGLKKQINDGTEPSLTFREIKEVLHPKGRVVLFRIPACPQGIPIAWKGKYYARAGENLTHLSLDKQDYIRKQDSLLDWTAQVVEDANLSDLSDEAIRVARRAFIDRNKSRIPGNVVENWPTEKFLNYIGLVTKRGVTRAALLLLGKPESAYLLNPLMAELTWKLVGQETAYEHFPIPFILATTQLYAKIRNVKIRLLQSSELVQREIEKYDQTSILEAIHNCVAHQDYSKHSRISVIEYPDKIEFISVGSFYEGAPDDYALGGHVPHQYRNPALVQAMTHLNMIDHLGYGIERMNHSQRSRYLPLPDYDLQEEGVVKLTIYGRSIDEAYTKLLMNEQDLPFDDVLALDRVQKGRPVPDSAIRRLRGKGLIEGRKPHYRVAVSVAQATGTQAEYLKMRGQSDEYCCALITDYLKINGIAKKSQLNELVFPELSIDLTEEQKSNKVKNLLSKLSKKGVVCYKRSSNGSGWVLR